MIGVFGGTGKIGGDVVNALHAKSAPFKCIVRDPDKAAELDGVVGDGIFQTGFNGLKTRFV